MFSACTTRTHRAGVITHLSLLAIVLALHGCNSSGDNANARAERQADVIAQKNSFEVDRRRIEAEKEAREALIVEQRSYISARFFSVDEDFLEVELTNETAKDIDNIVGSLEVLDRDGNVVTGIALTNWVPGDPYLPRGGTTSARKSLALETSERRLQILEQAPEFKFIYTALRIQFVGESEINYLDPVPHSIPAPVKKAEPVNQVSPEDCAGNQISLETEEIYYPGPECEHIGRNMDSERFKLEYIDMCRSALGITAQIPFVARVQISSCIYETNRRGLTYRKRICCDAPE